MDNNITLGTTEFALNWGDATGSRRTNAARGVNQLDILSIKPSTFKQKNGVAVSGAQVIVEREVLGADLVKRTIIGRLVVNVPDGVAQADIDALVGHLKAAAASTTLIPAMLAGQR